VNVILTGLRGTGKSSVGKVLAQRLSFAFVDTDTRIEELAGCRIAAIVAQHGWEHFRALERQVVTQVATTDRHVVAAGGGTLIDTENARLLKTRGMVVLLVCEISILQRRLALGSNRPSLTGQGSAAVELAQVWEARRERYHSVADVTYDVSAESGNVMEDLERKAADIEVLLQQTPYFYTGERKEHSA
jgi:shikimate kinase